MDDFDFNDFKNTRYGIILALSKNPRNIAATFYTEKNRGIFGLTRKEIFSPYLSINLPSLCCFLKEKKEDICVFSSTLARGNIISVSTKSGVYDIKKKEIQNVFITYYDKPPASYKNLDLSKVMTCLYQKLPELDYLGSDEFTNEILISFILEMKYLNYFNGIPDNRRLNGYIKSYNASICNIDGKNYGLNLIEYADWGNLIEASRDFSGSLMKVLEFINIGGNVTSIWSFKEEYIIDFASQIIANLLFLQTNFYFNHGNLVVKNIFIKSAESKLQNDFNPLDPSEDYVSFDYEGMKHTSFISAKIGNFSQSSLNAFLGGKNIRVYNRNPAADIYFGIFPFQPDIKSNAIIGPYFKIDYTITSSSITKARYMGVPFYVSWDTATFLISFLMMPSVFYIVFTTPKLKHIFWDRLWSPDDYSKMYSRLHDAVKKGYEPNLDNVIPILRDVKIKCNLTKELFDGLKNYPHF